MVIFHSYFSLPEGTCQHPYVCCPRVNELGLRNRWSHLICRLLVLGKLNRVRPQGLRRKIHRLEVRISQEILGYQQVYREFHRPLLDFTLSIGIYESTDDQFRIHGSWSSTVDPHWWPCWTPLKSSRRIIKVRKFAKCECQPWRILHCKNKKNIYV